MTNIRHLLMTKLLEPRSPQDTAEVHDARGELVKGSEDKGIEILLHNHILHALHRLL